MVIVIFLYSSVGFLFPVISQANSMNHNNSDVRRDRLRIGLFGIDGVVFGIRLLLSLRGRLFKRMLFGSVVSMKRACFFRMDIGVWRHRGHRYFQLCQKWIACCFSHSFFGDCGVLVSAMLRGLLLIFAVFWLFFFTLLMVSRARAAVGARAKGARSTANMSNRWFWECEAPANFGSLDGLLHRAGLYLDPTVLIFLRIPAEFE